MNTSSKAVCTILVVAGIIGATLFLAGNKSASKLGYSGQADNISEATEFNQVGLAASRSQQGVISTGPARLYGVELMSDATSLRYLQLFDMVASVANGFGQSTNKPVGSYQRYASKSLVVSIPIPAATSSTSPTIVRLDSTQFAPARYFTKGIIFGISSVFGSYSSASVTTARHTVKVIYRAANTNQ